jgi:hypothetical protein
VPLTLRVRWSHRDGLGRAGPLGVKCFKAPPGDIPHYWVWSDELSPLIPVLGANH